jgi:hypothetical protein
MDSAQRYQAFPTTAQRFDIRPGEHPQKLRLFKSRERLEAMLQDALPSSERVIRNFADEASALRLIEFTANSGLDHA